MGIFIHWPWKISIYGLCRIHNIVTYSIVLKHKSARMFVQYRVSQVLLYLYKPRQRLLPCASTKTVTGMHTRIILGQYIPMDK